MDIYLRREEHVYIKVIKLDNSKRVAFRKKDDFFYFDYDNFYKDYNKKSINKEDKNNKIK